YRLRLQGDRAEDARACGDPRTSDGRPGGGVRQERSDGQAVSRERQKREQRCAGSPTRRCFRLRRGLSTAHLSTMRISRRRLRRDVVRASMVLAALIASPPTRIAGYSANYLRSDASDPDFGPNVTIFDSMTPAATIQAKLDEVFKRQESSEFGDARYALLFKPGTYDVNAKVGF